MKISHLLPVVLVGLAACTAPCPPPKSAAAPVATAPVAAAPEKASPAPMPRVAKDVLCLDLKPEALPRYADCAVPVSATQTTDAPCADILPEFLEKYQECRKVAMGGTVLPVVEPVLDDVTITSNSRDPGVGNVSTTSSIDDGVRTVSITINDQTHTLSSNAPITPMPKWNITP